MPRFRSIRTTLVMLRCAAALVALAVVLAVSSHARAAPPRPNVVLIIADDMGWGDVGCFGGDLRTPHIDSIAREGARFTAWYVAAPVCTPSRYALMTGRHPRRARGGLGTVLMMLDPSHRTRGLRPGERTVAGLLRDAGYETALVGKWHLGHGDASHLPTAHGFTSFYGPAGGCIDYWTHRYAHVADWYRDEQAVDEPGYATALLTDEAVRFIQRGHDRPFMLCLSHVAPHYGKSIREDVADEAGTLITSPFGEPVRDRRSDRTVQPVNTLQARPHDLERVGAIEDDKRRHYAAMVTALDDGIGRVLEALATAGLDDDTLVIFMADNGPDRTRSSAGAAGRLRGAKHALWEGGIRVPCVMRWPGRIEPGRDVAAPCSALDVLPTLCALAGAELAGLTLDGIDARSVWRGETEAPTATRLLLWSHRDGRAVRRGRWKLHGDRLFDVVRDPGETTDLASRHPGVRDALVSAWEQWRESLSR